ncbi:AI-2E family transporter [Leptothrix ochracea]|uniref:AI-2E family transporter n=1 Tax=Leptothrix ochracea TaxID=735331 RepID=UPI0034E2CB8A
MSLTSTTTRLMMGWAVLGLAFVAGAWLLLPVLTPFVEALILAYILLPWVDRLARPGGLWPRPLAALVVEMLALGLLLGIVLLIAPVLSKQWPLLREQIPLLAVRLHAWLAPMLAELGWQVPLDEASLKAFVMKYLNANLEDGLMATFNSIRIGGSFLLALLGNVVLVPVVLYYVLVDRSIMMRRAHQWVPLRLVPWMRDFGAECNEVLGQYLRGQLRVIALLCVYYTGALALAGFDLALPLGVLTGCAILVPYVGFGAGALLALLAGLLQFPGLYGPMAVMLIYGAGQILEGFFLTPRLVGERIGLHPLAVIFMLLAFGHLFGLVGVLAALPVGAVALVALRRLRTLYHGSAWYLG